MSAYRETAVGIFVLVGILCVAWLAVKLGRMEVISHDGYELAARFSSVSGLRTGADVEISGVLVGRVSAITLDHETMQAVVRLRLPAGLTLSEDTIASVRTSGLIGDKYICLTPGGSPDVLAPGDMITETESALDIESLIGKFAFGSVKK